MSNLMKNTSPNISDSNYTFSDFNLEQKCIEFKTPLEKKSHVFIVFLGTLIGCILSLFFAYSFNSAFIFILLLSILPISTAYVLRKVYVNTMIQIDK